MSISLLIKEMTKHGTLRRTARTGSRDIPIKRKNESANSNKIKQDVSSFSALKLEHTAEVVWVAYHIRKFLLRSEV